MKILFSLARGLSEQVTMGLLRLEHAAPSPMTDSASGQMSTPSTSNSCSLSSSIMNAFSLFHRLPPELRLQIWHHTFDRSRSVRIGISIKDHGFAGWKAIDDSGKPPPALHVCRESRVEALKYYELSFGTSKYPPAAYFSSDYDTLDMSNWDSRAHDTVNSLSAAYLLNLWFGKTLRSYDSAVADSAKVKSLIIDVSSDLYSRPLFCWDEIRRFENLQDLVLVAWDMDDQADDLVAFFRSSLARVESEHADWRVPRIKVIDAHSGRPWSSLNVSIEDDTEPAV